MASTVSCIALLFLTSSSIAFQLKPITPIRRSLHTIDSSPQRSNGDYSTYQQADSRGPSRNRGGNVQFNNNYNDDFYNSQRRRNRGNDMNHYASDNQGGYLQSNFGNDDSLVQLSSEGRPLHARVEEWKTAGHTPFTVESYSQDAGARPLRVYSPSPDSAHTMAIRNTGPMEFPLDDISNMAGRGGSRIQGNSLRTYSSNPSLAMTAQSWPKNRGRAIDGEGAVATFPVPGHVQQVHLYINSEGYDVSADIEVLNGPNCVKQEFQVHSENGKEKPFLAIIDTPGPSGHTIRVQNTGPMTYPIRADVQPIKNHQGEGYEDDREQERFSMFNQGSRQQRRASYFEDRQSPNSQFNQGNQRRQQQRMPVRAQGGSFGEQNSRFNQRERMTSPNSRFNQREQMPSPNSRSNQREQVTSRNSRFDQREQMPSPNSRSNQREQMPSPNSRFDQREQTPNKNRASSFGDGRQQLQNPIAEEKRERSPARASSFGDGRQQRQNPSAQEQMPDRASLFNDRERQNPISRFDQEKQMPIKNRAQSDSSFYSQGSQKQAPITNRVQSNSSLNDRERQIPNSRIGQDNRQQMPSKNSVQSSSFDDLRQEFQTPSSWFENKKRQQQTGDRSNDPRRERQDPNTRFGQENPSRLQQEQQSNDSFFQRQAPSARAGRNYNTEQPRNSFSPSRNSSFRDQPRQVPSYMQERSNNAYMGQTGFSEQRVIPSYLRDSPTGGGAYNRDTPWQQSSDQRRPW